MYELALLPDTSGHVITGRGPWTEAELARIDREADGFTDIPDRMPLAVALVRARIEVAGWAAVGLLTGNYGLPGTQHEINRARRYLAAAMPEAYVGGHLHDCWHSTLAWLGSPLVWAASGPLAAALLKRGRLTGLETYRIFTVGFERAARDHGIRLPPRAIGTPPFIPLPPGVGA